jgi:hypothetical protein
MYLTIRRRRISIIYGLFVVIMSSLVANNPVDAAEAARITTSVELRHVQPLLRRVATPLQSGFGRSEADRVAAEIRKMPANQPVSWTFTVRYRGSEYALEIRALLDELGTVDLDFATSQDLAPVLRIDVDGYLNAHNL